MTGRRRLLRDVLVGLAIGAAGLALLWGAGVMRQTTVDSISTVAWSDESLQWITIGQGERARTVRVVPPPGQFKLSPALKSDMRFARRMRKRENPSMPADEFERRTLVHEQERIEKAKFHAWQRQQHDEAMRKLKAARAGW